MTASGILIPEIAKERPQVGLILAVGPGRLNEAGKRLPMSVQEGDRILFAKYTGTEVTLNDEHRVLILRESDVLAIQED